MMHRLWIDRKGQTALQTYKIKLEKLSQSSWKRKSAKLTLQSLVTGL